jgi:putative lipoprotein
LHRDDRIDAASLVTLPANASGLACAPVFVEERGMRSILSNTALVLALAACQPSAPTPAPAPVAASPASTAPASTAPAPSPVDTATPPPAASSGDSHAQHWQCGEVLLDARLDGETMHLAFSGRTLTLPHVESLTGARYADAAGNAFMRQAEAAKLILVGDESRDCTRSDHVSPWIEAASRGIAFRAVGNEPGWFVEVEEGDSPSLHATLDYGDREIIVAKAQPAGLGFTGKTADGTTVVLEVQRARCQDGMSGEAFEATAQLVVGDKRYRGCGAFLAD